VTTPEPVGRAPWWPVALILFLTALVYFHSFGQTPIYLGGDEARFGTAADSIARTGRNLNGDRMPLFFHLGDSLDVRETSTRWYQPVLFYLIALTLKFLPLGEGAIRLPTAIIGLVDVFLIYAVARRLFRGALYPIVAAMTLAMTPAHLIFSRQALDYICPLPFVLGWLWCFVETLETGSVWASLGCGVLLGVGFYSYIAAWMLMPSFLGMTLLAQWASGTRKWRVPAAAAAGFAVPLLAFVPWLSSHSDMWHDTVGRYKVYDPRLSPLQGAKDLLAYNSVQERISVYWDYFNPAFLFFSGGSNLTHGTRLAGVFLLPVAVFLVAGVYELCQQRPRIVGMVLLAGLAIAPIPATLVDERYAIQRTLIVVPFAVLVALFGVSSLLRKSNSMVRFAAAALLLAMPVQYASFYRDYFTDYRVRSAYWFDPINFRSVAELLIASDMPDAPQLVYVSQDLDDVPARWMFYLAKHHREDLLPRTRMFTAAGLDLATIPAGSLLVLYANDPVRQAWTATGTVSTLSVVAHAGGANSAVILRKKGR
jgi:4-amino-4-deoxy-L-arabinose transferase-like glycosyltransferase